MSRSFVSLSVVFLAVLAVVVGTAGIAQAALVGYWPLNDTSGTTAVDQSGAAITNNGTYTQATVGQTSSTSPFGTFATFNGASGGSGVYIPVTAGSAFAGIGGTALATECGWYYLPTALPGGKNPLLFGGSGNNGQLFIGGSSGQLQFFPGPTPGRRPDRH